METKKAEKAPLTHDRLQAECYQWHVNTFPDDRHLVHANLSNSVGGRYGAHNKAIGVRAGRADMQYYKNGVLNLMEFKVGSDRQKRAQRDFQEANENEGAYYVIIRSIEDYMELICEIRGEYGIDHSLQGI